MNHVVKLMVFFNISVTKKKLNANFHLHVL